MAVKLTHKQARGLLVEALIKTAGVFDGQK